ncbi:hypothetical protein SEVIR_2G141751v4 [Setaria viridis]
MSGVASAVPLTIEKIEVNLDFHIFDILDFDLLIGYPLENPHLDGASQWILDGKLRETASTTTTSCLENPMAKPLPEQNSLKTVMHASPLVSSEPVLFEFIEYAALKECDLNETLHLCEDERSPSPSIEFEPLPVGPYHVVFNHDEESTLIYLPR